MPASLKHHLPPRRSGSRGPPALVCLKNQVKLHERQDKCLRRAVSYFRLQVDACSDEQSCGLIEVQVNAGCEDDEGGRKLCALVMDNGDGRSPGARPERTSAPAPHPGRSEVRALPRRVAIAAIFRDWRRSQSLQICRPKTRFYIFIRTRAK